MVTGLTYKSTIVLQGNLGLQPRLSDASTVATTGGITTSVPSVVGVEASALLPTTTLSPEAGVSAAGKTVPTLWISPDSKIPTSNLLPQIVSNATIKVADFTTFRLVNTSLTSKINALFGGKTTQPTVKFSPYEELSGIATSRPEIISVSGFKPLFSDDAGFTPAGEFLDAQIKLMNLRHEVIVTLVNDLKKDSELVKQFDEIEANFLSHVRNFKSQADFLIELQKYIERLTQMLDLRDGASGFDSVSLIKQFFGSNFTNLSSVKSSLSNLTYVDLLAQHGFNKVNVTGFSSTKILLQTLFESKKILCAGSDELVGVDPSIVSRDIDPVTLNRRIFKDPHIELSKIDKFPTLTQANADDIHKTDSRLTSYLQTLEIAFKDMDVVFQGLTSDEAMYTAKLRTLARETLYSHVLLDPETHNLLSQYGYLVDKTTGNQSLFDAVYGSLGDRITDDKVNSNTNAVASIVSRAVDDNFVLTYEVDYLEDDNGSVFTPGAAYYVASSVKPSINGFSTERASGLLSRMTAVSNNYANFITKFNLLPLINNKNYTTLSAPKQIAINSIRMSNTLYEIFVDVSTGLLKNDVVGNPIVDLMAEAAIHPYLRANLLVYFGCVTDVNYNAASGEDIEQEGRNTRTGATVDKLINNCVNIYKQLTKNVDGASKIEYILKNHDNGGPLTRCVQHIKTLRAVHREITDPNTTRYSRLSDNMMLALTMQTTLDSARRYAYGIANRNPAFSINSNFSKPSVNNVLNPSGLQIRPFSNRTSVVLDDQPAVVQRNPQIVLSPYLSKQPLYQAITSRLEREEELVVRTVMASLAAVRTVRDELLKFVTYLQRSESASQLKELTRIVGDIKLVEMLSDRGQVQLINTAVNDVLDRINNASTEANKSKTDLTDVISIANNYADNDLKILDDSFITSKTSNVLKAALANAKYNIDNGSNIRLVAFGLPHGFSTKLRNKFKLTTFVEQINSKRKQNDVIIADVYKMDVRYPDIIFKPLPKIFELSRFPVRNESMFRDVEVGATLSTVLDAVPTKDYSSLEFPVLSYGIDALQKTDYDFMTDNDRRTMVRNHVTSYMFELYYRLLTGIPLTEQELHMSDPNDVAQPASFVTRTLFGSVMQNTYKIAVDPSTFELQTDELSDKTANGVIALAEAGAKLSNKRTVYSDPNLAGRQMMSPKLFERVFFVDVDPDDFEVDKTETFKTPAGRAAFEQLMQAGELVTTTETFNRLSSDTFKLKDRKIEKQMTFEKYFVTVRVYSPLSSRST